MILKAIILLLCYQSKIRIIKFSPVEVVEVINKRFLCLLLRLKANKLEVSGRAVNPAEGCPNSLSAYNGKDALLLIEPSSADPALSGSGIYFTPAAYAFSLKNTQGAKACADPWTIVH